MNRQKRPMPRSATRAVARSHVRAVGATSGHHALAVTAALLTLLALLPSGWVAWAGWFGSLADKVIAPISHPISSAASLLRPPESREHEHNVETLEEELNLERFNRLQAENRAKRLAAQLAELTRAAQINPDIEVRLVPAPRTGQTSTGLLNVRASRAQGVVAGSIATAAAVQLVGTIEDVDASTGLCRVLPFTNRAVNPMGGIVMLDDAGSATRACLLTPQGDGTLRGDVESAGPDAPAATLAVGQTVRLRDDAWPEHAQMLVLGRIERVEPHPQAPLRSVITVRPTVDPLQVSEVVIRAPINAPGNTGGAG